MILFIEQAIWGTKQLSDDHGQIGKVIIFLIAKSCFFHVVFRLIKFFVIQLRLMSLKNSFQVVIFVLIKISPKKFHVRVHVAGWDVFAIAAIAFDVPIIKSSTLIGISYVWNEHAACKLIEKRNNSSIISIRSFYKLWRTVLFSCFFIFFRKSAIKFNNILWGKLDGWQA